MSSDPDLRNDKRIAAQISTQLSRTLIMACLAMLAILGGVFTTLLPRLAAAGVWYYVLIVLIVSDFVIFIMSIMNGGRAVAAVYSSLSSGDWSLESTRGSYNRQAAFAFVGLVLLIGIVILGSFSQIAEKSDNATVLEKLKNSVEVIEKARDILSRVEIKKP